MSKQTIFIDKVKALDKHFNEVEILNIKTKPCENALRKAQKLYAHRTDIEYFQWA
jgi:hypothetical protein